MESVEESTSLIAAEIEADTRSIDKIEGKLKLKEDRNKESLILRSRLLQRCSLKFC